MRQINEIIDYERPDIVDMAVVATIDAVTASNTLVPITGLALPLRENSTYEFEALLSCNTGNNVNGCEYGINFSAAGAAIQAYIFGAVTTATSKMGRIVLFHTATAAFLTTANQDGGVLIRGMITTGANKGILTVEHLKVVGLNSTVRIGSWLKTTKIE